MLIVHWWIACIRIGVHAENLVKGVMKVHRMLKAVIGCINHWLSFESKGCCMLIWILDILIGHMEWRLANSKDWRGGSDIFRAACLFIFFDEIF